MAARVTLKHIADRVGVSRVAVSAALGMLSDRSQVRLSADKAREIRRVAEALGYHRSNLARALQRNRTQTVGVLFRVVSNPQPVSYLIDCIDRELMARGYRAQLGPFHARYDILEHNIRELVGWQVDGLIVCFVYESDDREGRWPALDAWLCKVGTPLVFVESTLETTRRHPRVGVDFAAAAETAAQHLIAGGCRRLAYVGPRKGADMARWAGVQRAASVADIQAEWLALDLSIASSPTLEDVEAAQRVGYDLASRKDRPTGLICSNDEVAGGLLTALRRKGLRIPGDVAIVGYHNSQTALLTVPTLSTMQEPAEEMARAAVKTLLDRIAGRRSAVNLRFAPRLVVRESSRPAAHA